jgi:hypothetical protein
MTAPAIYTLSLPGPMLKRGFWLYVWRAQTPDGEMLYVGRTGDNSSPYATAPYTRMGQHLGNVQTQNALRKHLKKKNLDPEQCSEFHLIACGPLYPEVGGEGLDRAALMNLHVPIRNIVGAMEKALAFTLSEAGYHVLNSVSWNHPLDDRLWRPVLEAFAGHFPKLAASKVTGGAQ